MNILWKMAAFLIGATIQAPPREDSKSHWLLVQTQNEDVTEDRDDSNEKNTIEHEDDNRDTARKDYSYGDGLTASAEERNEKRLEQEKHFCVSGGCQKAHIPRKFWLACRYCINKKWR